MTASTAKVAAAKKPSLLRALAIPALGFGIGWGSYSLVEQYGLVDASVIRSTHLWNLRCQRFLQERVPDSIGSSLFFAKDQLDAMIRFLETAPSPPEDNRIPFSKILNDCRPQEQLEWLTDHILEDIPYFFIADIFHSWAELHEACIVNASVQADHVFDSKALCEGVWSKMRTEVIPFDVGVRVLCILARKSTSNAKWIVSSIRSQGAAKPVGDAAASTAPANRSGVLEQDPCAILLSMHKQYHTQLEGSNHPSGNVVPAQTVDAATAGLLVTLNHAAIHGRRFPWIGRQATGPYPLLVPAAHRDAWCAQLGHLMLDTLPAGIAHVTQRHFKCDVKQS